jgi:hypothetical protein
MHEKRPWETPGHVANLTWTRGAYKPYSTYEYHSVRVFIFANYLTVSSPRLSNGSLLPAPALRGWSFTLVTLFILRIGVACFWGRALVEYTQRSFPFLVLDDIKQVDIYFGM